MLFINSYRPLCGFCLPCLYNSIVLNISFIRIKHSTRERFFVKLSITNHRRFTSQKPYRTSWAGCQTNIPCSSHKIRTTGSSMLLKTLLESANQRAYAQPRVFATEQVPAFRNFTAPYRTGFREGETVVFLFFILRRNFQIWICFAVATCHTGAASHTTCHQARQPSSDGCEPLYLEYPKIRAPGSGACV